MTYQTAQMRKLTSDDFERGKLLEIAPGVACLPLSIVNMYFVGAPGGSWVLVDAGMHLSTRSILHAARERFGERKPEAIVLTHGHFDHVGALRQLAQIWDVPVYAHPLEHPYLDGRSSYPPPEPLVGRGAMSTMSFMYPRGPIHVGDRLRMLMEGGLAIMPGWRIVHTPGHTPGHVCFFREEDRVLIAGDAFVTTRQESMIWALNGGPEVNGPPAYFTSDWDSARDSVQKLADLEPEVAGTGHGVPMSGIELREQLHWLADNFDRVARPQSGRYAHKRAVADESGVVFVPPATRESRAIMAGIGAAAIVAGFAMALIMAGNRRA